MIAERYHTTPRDVRDWPGDDVERVLILWSAEGKDRAMREAQRG